MRIFAVILVIAVAVLAVVGVDATHSQRPFRLVIQFGSHCCGPDGAKLSELQRTLRGFEAKIGKRVAHTVAYWGREGDLTYCFRLDELTRADRERFLADIRKLDGVTTRGTTKVFEDAACSGHGPVHSIKRVE